VFYVFILCVRLSLNGVPSCTNKRLLTDILRGEWKFKGYVVSDDDALEHIVNDHHYVPTYVEAAAAAVRAGCNLELTGDGSGWVFSYLLQVVALLHFFQTSLFSVAANGWIKTLKF